MMVARVLASALLLLGATSFLQAQEALSNGLPLTVENDSPTGRPGVAWLDLRQRANAKPQSAPRWVEAVGLTPAQNPAAKSVFRIRLARPGTNYDMLFFRLFFTDRENARPEVVAWDESGTQVLRSGELGSGLGLPSSESIVIPMMGASTIDVEVPGNGKNVRGAYLDWMTSSQIAHPLSADSRDVIPMPFSAVPPLHAPEEDTEQFGTVTATLAPGTIRIGADIKESAVFQFGVETQPLLAMITFELVSARVDAPPEIYLNGEGMGPVSLALPELADPGYRGQMEALVRQMHFQYTGWVRAQKILPVASLKVGSNDLVIVNGQGAASSAIRAVQVQLKYLWDKSDYVLKVRR